MRNALFVLLGLLIGVALYVVGAVTKRTPEAPPGSPSVPEATGITAIGSARDEGLDLTAEEDALRDERTEEVQAVAAETTPAEDTKADLVEITGTIVVVDDRDGEHAGESGTIEFLLLRKSDEPWKNAGTRTVNVQDGFFRVDIPLGNALLPDDILIGGMQAVVMEGVERKSFDTDGEMHIRARWLYTHRLHVRDGDSGVELGDVELVEVQNWQLQQNEHPGRVAEAEVVHASVRSPIELPPSRRSQVTYHARSSGYAWGRVEIAPAKSKDRYLDLFPGGGLDVRVEGARPPKGAVVRLHSDELFTRPFFEEKLTGSTLRIDGLRTGSYRVRVEVGDWFDRPVVLGTSEVTIVAGDHSSVAVVVEYTEPVVKVPFEGRLILPPEWEVSRGMLTVELIGTAMDGTDGRTSIDLLTMKVLDAQSGTRRWNAGEVEPGRYELKVFNIEHTAAIEVGPQGNTDAVFEIPPPATVTVTVIDESTGLVAGVDGVHWHATRPEGVTGGGLASVQPDEQGRFVFRAPIGEIQLSTWGGKFSRAHDTLAVHAGDNTATLHVRPSQGFLLRLYDGDSLIPWNWDYRIEVEAKGHDGSSGTRTTNEKGFTVYVTEPGSYEVGFPEIDGFHPIDPQVIDIPEAEVIELDIQLERLN